MNFFPHTPQDDTMARGQVEYLKGEGNKAPTPKRGDRYILAGTVAGIFVGGLTGLLSGNPLFFIVGIIGGGIVGMWIGSLVKGFTNRRHG